MLFALLLLADALPAQARLEAALLAEAKTACPGRPIVLDADLTRACQKYVAAVQSGKAQPGGSAVSFFASIESSEASLVASVARGDPSRADRGAAALVPPSCRFNRAGVAGGLLRNGEAIVCALTADHQADLAQIPGSVDEFESVRVAGRLAPGFSNPRLFVARPSGEVEELGLVAANDEFATRIPLAETGEHSIEVLADGPGGPRVVALRRVFVGVKPPDTPPPEPKVGAGLSGVEAAIARLRTTRGLPPLERDPQLDAIALGHSREMARTRTFAHVLPSDGSMADRLRARGYPYRSAGENIGLATDASAAHEAIVGSPAHLANLLDPRHRRLGLGEARGPTPEGPQAVYLTELLAAPAVATRDPAADALRILDQQRRKRHLTALRRDPALDRLAEGEACEAAKIGDAQLSGAAKRALDKVPELKSAVAELFVGGAPDMVGDSKNLAEPRWTRLGVGAVYASSKSYGAGSLWVVLVFGR